MSPRPESDDPPALSAVIDSDVDLHDAGQRAETRPREWDLLLAISAGGVVGTLARYGLDTAIPHGSAEFPWSTLLINVTGCLLIGVLMGLLGRRSDPPRLARPFLGVGVLGGFTTFSTFAVQTQQLLTAHRPQLALGYLLLTVLGGALAVWVGSSAVRRRTARVVTA